MRNTTNGPVPTSANANATANANTNAYLFLTEEARSNLSKYQYKGQDKSLLYNYVLSPLASFLVNHYTPSSIAPNTITLFGLCWMMVSYASLWYYAPDVSTPSHDRLAIDETNASFDTNYLNVNDNGHLVPSWVFAYHCCALLIYQTLDNMDGKQARRTGSSSPLGLLFDHGCDAINSIFGSAGWIVGLGLTFELDYYMCLAIILGPFAMFYVATWEEFFTGELILPTVNGPNEGLLGGALLSLAACVYPDFWQSTSLYHAFGLQHVISSPLRNADLQVSLAVFGMLQEIVSKAIFVSQRHGISTLTHQLPLWILISLLVLNTNLWMSMPRTALHLSSALFVEIVTHLMLDHITNQPFQVLFRCWILVPLMILTLVDRVITTGTCSATTMSCFEGPQFQFDSIALWWLIYTTAVWTFLLCKIRWVVHEICCALNLKCFVITPIMKQNIE